MKFYFIFQFSFAQIWTASSRRNKGKKKQKFGRPLGHGKFVVNNFGTETCLVSFRLTQYRCDFGQEQTSETDGSSSGSGAATPSTPSNEAIAMKKALEWELSLDSRDLRSHAWYYSAIPRQRAEEIVEKDGDFLVRDCVSQPGNFVLTCKSKAAILHFVINKVSGQQIQSQQMATPFFTHNISQNHKCNKEKIASAYRQSDIHYRYTVDNLICGHIFYSAVRWRNTTA